MIKKLALAALVFALGSVTALAADFNGKWTAEVPGRNGNQTITFEFHVDGSTLTGKITTARGDADITNGKVSGDTITFDQVSNFNGNSMTQSYSGTAQADGTIKFTRSMAGGGMGGGGGAPGGGGGGPRPPTEFTATKAQ